MLLPGVSLLDFTSCNPEKGNSVATENLHRHTSCNHLKVKYHLSIGFDDLPLPP